MESKTIYRLLSSNIFKCKHVVPIISILYQTPLRFSELSVRLGLNPKVLARKLLLLKSEGLIWLNGLRYRLTEDGKQVAEAMTPLLKEISPQVLGDVLKCKWSREILANLWKGPKYSVKIVEELDGLSWKVASERLKKLQRYGLIRRTVHSEDIPLRITYELTRKGKLLALWFLSISNCKHDIESIRKAEADGWTEELECKSP